MPGRENLPCMQWQQFQLSNSSSRYTLQFNTPSMWSDIKSPKIKLLDANGQDHAGWKYQPGWNQIQTETKLLLSCHDDSEKTVLSLVCPSLGIDRPYWWWAEAILSADAAIWHCHYEWFSSLLKLGNIRPLIHHPIFQSSTTHWDLLLTHQPHQLHFVPRPEVKWQWCVLNAPYDDKRKPNRGQTIKFIHDPDPYVQVDAISRDPYNIQYIKNPSLEMQLLAVRKEGKVIRFIQDPVYEVQYAAIEDNPWSLPYIAQPDLKIQFQAITLVPDLIRFIHHPDPSLQVLAALHDGDIIRHLHEPSLGVIEAALQQKGSAITWIEQPTPQMQLWAVQQDPYAIQFMARPTRATQLAAVKRCGLVIAYIADPDLSIQLAAVRQDPWAITKIKDPSLKVKLVAAIQGGLATLQYIPGFNKKIKQMAQRSQREKKNITTSTKRTKKKKRKPIEHMTPKKPETA
jgi:hypothetical protein